MKKNRRIRLRNGFSQTICKFFNIFSFCSRQSKSCLVKDPSYSNTFMVPTPVIKQSNMYLSQSQIDRNPLKLSFYSTTFTSIDQTCQKKEPVSSFSSTLSPSSSSSSSSSSTSNCHLSLTIHHCYSTSKVTTATPTNIRRLNKSMTNIEKLSLPTAQTPSRFSYLIRPSTPCIFGRETYDDEPMNDDEFFLTAGGIIHSCPNIYELSTDDNRKLQSCDHLMFIDQQTKLIDNDNLNCYDTELDRYSILPRFRQNSSVSSSKDSFDSQLKLYKERHAIGFSRPCPDDISIYYSSLLPTTWRSDNYLLLIPLIHHQSSSLLNSISHGKRSHSYDIPLEQTYSSIVA